MKDKKGWYVTIWNRDLRDIEASRGPFKKLDEAKATAERIHSDDEVHTGLEYRDENGRFSQEENLSLGDDCIWPQVHSNGYRKF